MIRRQFLEALYARRDKVKSMLEAVRAESRQPMAVEDSPEGHNRHVAQCATYDADIIRLLHEDGFLNHVIDTYWETHGDEPKNDKEHDDD